MCNYLQASQDFNILLQQGARDWIGSGGLSLPTYLPPTVVVVKYVWLRIESGFAMILEFSAD